jgi:hypothetical protein
MNIPKFVFSALRLSPLQFACKLRLVEASKLFEGKRSSKRHLKILAGA